MIDTVLKLKNLKLFFTITVLLVLFLTTPPTTHAFPPTDFVTETLITDLNQPTAIEFLPDGRMLIIDRFGAVDIVQAGASQVDATPFMTLTNVNTQMGERGLTGIALDPDFDTNGYFYLFYTANSPLVDRVSRFTASGNTASVLSEFVVWQDNDEDGPVEAPVWHHGGSVQVGSGNKLYISIGDGFDRANEVQSLTSYRGKLLRVNLNGSIPTDNPFYDGAGPNLDAIWALGLRNPFRFSFDNETGRMYIGDVGGNDAINSHEEVNLGAAGANYGWPICEGPQKTQSGGNCTPPTNPGTYQSPFYSYPHAGRDSSVVGGLVYRDGNFPTQYDGDYFYGDYVQNWVRGFDLDPQSGTFIDTFNFEPTDGSSDGPYGEIVDFEQGPDGAVYYVDIGISWENNQNPGTVRRIKYTATNQAPQITNVSASITSSPTVPATIDFTLTATDPEGQPLSYSWAFDDGSSSSTEQNPSYTYTTKGSYTVRVTVSDGVNQTLSDPIQLIIGIPPTIDTFTVSTLSDQTGDPITFRAGETVDFSASASDADSTLTGANYSWNVALIHLSHTHPEVGPLSGTSGTFDIPVSGHEINDEISFQFILTVTDSDGLSDTQAVQIYPETVELSFDTVPTGLDLVIDGFTRTTPFILTTVIDFQHSISAPSTQGIYTFDSWSDEGTATHTILAPDQNLAYTATYESTTPEITGLLAGYSFEEGTGSVVTDISGNGKNLTLVGSPTWATGRYGGGLTMDGSNDRGSVADFQLPAQFTYAAWVFNPSTQPYETIMTVGGLRDYYLDNGVQAFHNGGDIAVGTLVPTGSWEHIALTYNGSQLRAYLNGVAVGNPQTIALPQVTNTFQLASWINGSSNVDFFSGTMDEVRVYDRELSSTELQSIMNTPLPGGNTSPEAINDTVQTPEDTSINITVLANDSDPDDDVLEVIQVTEPTNGVAVINQNNTVTYSPDTNYFGTDAFEHTISDGRGGTDTATVSLTVTAVNDTPVANAQSLSTQENTELEITLTASDIENDTLSYIIVTPPTNGILTGTENNRVYTPNANYIGSDTIEFIVNDGELDSNVAIISISVTEVNDAPVASDDEGTTNEDTGVTLDVLDNDTDANDDELTIISTSTPTNGTVQINIDQTLTYSPAANYNGSDVFTYTVSDGVLTDVGTVTLAITPVNDAPEAASQQLSTPQNTQLFVTLTAADIENSTLTYTVIDLPGNGILTGSGANLTYTPDVGFVGSDSLTFRANDGELDSNIATVSITVTSAYTPASLQFDGSNDTARFVDLPLSTTFTYEAWIKRTSDSGSYEAIMSDANSGYGQAMFTVFIDGAGSDCGNDHLAYYQAAENQTQCSGVSIALDQWYHVAVSRESNGTRKIFVNGVLASTNTSTTAPSNSNGIFAIGSAGSYKGEYFAGRIDEVRLSNTARYTANFTPSTTRFTGDANTVALYHLDAGTGQTLVDSSGNNRNGVLGTTSSTQTTDPTWQSDSPTTN